MIFFASEPAVEMLPNGQIRGEEQEHFQPTHPFLELDIDEINHNHNNHNHNRSTVEELARHAAANELVSALQRFDTVTASNFDMLVRNQIDAARANVQRRRGRGESNTV